MIKDYAELVVEATQRSGITSLPNRAPMLVGMAEDYISRTLEQYYTPYDPLVETGTNEFLADEPEAYLQAVIFQALVSEGRTEEAATVKSYLNELLRRIRYDMTRRAWKDIKIDPASFGRNP